MKVLLLGATGATGKALLPRLLADPAITEVVAFVRRAPRMVHNKLCVHEVDFANPARWQAQVCGDVLVSCLGTTLKDAGSQEAQWQVDFGYQYAFAQAAQANGVAHCILLSSLSARADARLFYPRMKGELEDAVRALGFPALTIFRPPLLLRPGSRRTGEVWAARLLALLNALGLARSQRPMPVEQLAQALHHAAKRQNPGLEILEPARIRALAGTG